MHSKVGNRFPKIAQLPARHPAASRAAYEEHCNSCAIGIRNGLALGAVLWLAVLAAFAVLAS